VLHERFPKQTEYSKIMKNKYQSLQRSTAALLAIASLAGAANAAVVSFTINQTFSQGGGVASDLPETSVSIGGAGSFFVDPGNSKQYFDFRFATGTFSTLGFITDADLDTYYVLESFAYGSLIDSTTVGVDASAYTDLDSILVNDVTTSPWDNTHDGALGFISDSGQYGYINYEFQRSVNANTSTITFTDGAYESKAGVGINVVPEPTAGLLLGLGSMGLLLRRKRH